MTSTANPALYHIAPDGALEIDLHEGQIDTIDSDKRFVIVLAGTQSGKTVLGPIWLWNEMLARGPGDYFVVAPTYPMLALKALPEFLNFFERTMRVGEFIGSPTRRFVVSDEGARRMFGPDRDPTIRTVVYFGHATDPESLESATVKAAWLDEAGQKKFRGDSWDAITRRLAIHQGRVLITTTPYNLGWLKQRLYDPWVKASQQHVDIDVINFASTMNPAFPVEEFERARRELPRWKFDMMYRGRFTRPAGLIYDNVSDLHRSPRFPIPPNWPRFVGLDFGGINTAAVFIAQECDQDGKPVSPVRYFAYREYYPREGRTAKEHALALLKDEPRIPRCVGGARSEGQWRIEFGQAGLPVHESPVIDVEVGINRVYKMFATDALVIFDDLAGLWDELGSYSRVLDERGEATDDIDEKETFHHLDALRYVASKLMHGSTFFFRAV